MAPSLGVAALSLFAAGASALQIPLQAPQPQAQTPLSGAPAFVSSESLQATINVDNLFARAEALYAAAKLSEEEYGHPTRVIGSPGHRGTLDYIYNTLISLGDYYDVSKQTFPAVDGHIFESKLVLGSDIPDSAAPMSLTPPTAHKEPVFGSLVLVSNDGCEESDFPSSVSDSIAFIRRGTCSFGTKSANAGKAGALAAVVFNYEDGRLSGTLGTPVPSHVATFGMSGSDAAPYLEKLAQGETVEGSAYIDSVVQTIQTVNIIAQTKEGDADNCVMLGGHSDSVSEGPGINDDGSGSATVLEVAVQLAKFRVKNCVRFAWWSGEEEGLLGSDYYVEHLSESENQKIRLFMDYDMLASPNYAYQVYNATNDVNPVGSQELRDLYTTFYTTYTSSSSSKGQNFTYIPFDGRSDYDAFIKAGIPGGGIATGAEGVKTAKEQEMFGGVAGEWYDSCYHQLCDDLKNLDLGAWEVNARLVAHSVATYAKSFEGFPERVGVKEVATMGDEYEYKYHGPTLIL